MAYIRRPLFWCAMVVGWLIVLFVLAVIVRLFGAFEEMSFAQKLMLLLGMQGLSSLAGVMYARSYLRRSDCC